MKKIIFAFVVAMIYSCTTTPVAPVATEENDSTEVVTDTTEVITEVVDTTTEVVVQEQ